MNPRNVIISIVIVIFLCAGIYLYFSNDTFKNNIDETFKTDKKEVFPEQSFNSVFTIFDPSGSGTVTYSVPKITIENINTIIDAISSTGSGEFWLTYIDKNGWNNRVLHFFIHEKPQPPQMPTRNSGEAKYKFNQRLEQFQKDSLEYKKNIGEFYRRFNNEKERFLSDCKVMLQEGYAKKKPGEDYSDIIGSLNAALRSLSTVPNDSQHYFRSILLISDGVQDLSLGQKSQQLNNIPDDIAIVTVNNSGSRNNIVAKRTIEVDNLDRALQYVIRK